MGRQRCPNGHRHFLWGRGRSRVKPGRAAPCEPRVGPGHHHPGAPDTRRHHPGAASGQDMDHQGLGQEGGSHRAGEDGRGAGPTARVCPQVPGREEVSWGGGPGWAPLMFWPRCPGSSGGQQGPPGSHAWMLFVPGSLAADPSASSRSWAEEAWGWGTESRPVLPAFPPRPEAWRTPPREGVGQAACAPTGGPLLEAGCLSQPRS